MTRVESFSGVPAGAIVTLRRGALTGERVERTKAWTAGEPFYTASGVACIRVDIGGAVVSYPLDRVSLGWDEPRPAPVTLAMALDPPPEELSVARFVLGAAVVALIYAVGLGLSGLLDWVAR